MKKLSNKELWSIFERKGPLANQEIDVLISESKKALKYFKNRVGFESVIIKINADIMELTQHLCVNSKNNMYFIRDDDGNITALQPIERK